VKADSNTVQEPATTNSEPTMTQCGHHVCPKYEDSVTEASAGHGSISFANKRAESEISVSRDGEYEDDRQLSGM
jgi:hypothetical protein